MDLQTFTQKLNANSLPVVVDVWAPWCLPCRSISPALEQLSRRYQGQVDLWKLDADQEKELVQQLGILGIPTLLVYAGGQEITRSAGAQPMQRLDDLFQAALTGQPPAQRGLAPTDRLLRLGAALALLMLAWNSGLSPLLLAAAAIVAFSAVYDRCPIWNALFPRLKKLFSARPG